MVDTALSGARPSHDDARCHQLLAWRSVRALLQAAAHAVRRHGLNRHVQTSDETADDIESGVIVRGKHRRRRSTSKLPLVLDCHAHGPPHDYDRTAHCGQGGGAGMQMTETGRSVGVNVVET